MSVRLARPEDARLLPDIERSAGESFRALPHLAWIADDEVGAPEFHTPLIAAGSVWVAENATGDVVGFLTAERFDRDLHVWELAVAYPAQGQGLGRALMAQAAASARQAGLARLTLTTFAEVAWNAPFYRRLGYEVLPPEADPRLAKILQSEAERGLAGRCAMQLAL